jgi:hypothetical protein
MTKKPNHQTPDQPNKQLTVTAPPLVPATSDEALDQHLAEWGGSGGRLMAFNGQSGVHRTLADDVEVPSGTEFIAFLHETQRGFIKFNTDGPPDAHMVRIDENAEVPTRDSLGDNDETKWPIGLDGNRTDPWKEQFAFPMARTDAGGELFIYVARGVVAMNSVRDLLGRWRYHPKRRQGLIPVIAVKNGTYWSKRFNADRPKAELVIVGWVTKAGTPPPETKPVSLAEEMNEAIPDFSESSTTENKKK